MKKLVIIHTTPATIPSLGQLVGNLSQPWQVANLLDDSILPEINQAGPLPRGCVPGCIPSLPWPRL